MSYFKVGERAKTQSRDVLVGVPEQFCDKEVTIVGGLAERDMSCLVTGVPFSGLAWCYVVEFADGKHILAKPCALKKLTGPTVAEWAAKKVKDMLANVREPANA